MVRKLLKTRTRKAACLIILLLIAYMVSFATSLKFRHFSVRRGPAPCYLYFTDEPRVNDALYVLYYPPLWCLTKWMEYRGQEVEFVRDPASLRFLEN